MNIIIGSTSQLAQYFPDDYVKISSRNTTVELYDLFNNRKIDRVYLCFAEQRTYLNQNDDFCNINLNKTINIINDIKKYDTNTEIITYGTAELWNKYNGNINIDFPFNYYNTEYVISKHKMVLEIEKTYENVHIMYPFNFNSIHRKPPFLFGKIFDSIINKKEIEIGDTYYFRELLHPSFIVKESINANRDKIIGTGNLIFVNDFIRDLYKIFNMKYEKYVKENIETPSIYRKNIFYSSDRISNQSNYYNELLNITVKEINNELANQIG